MESKLRGSRFPGPASAVERSLLVQGAVEWPRPSRPLATSGLNEERFGLPSQFRHRGLARATWHRLAYAHSLPGSAENKKRGSMRRCHPRTGKPGKAHTGLEEPPSPARIAAL